MFLLMNNPLRPIVINKIEKSYSSSQIKNNMESFNEIINGDKPVLVDFYATWCGPCKVMGPTIEVVGKELIGQARVLKIDVDKNETVANQYRIQSVPTLIIFKKGEVVWRTSGVMDKNALMQQMKKFIN